MVFNDYRPSGQLQDLVVTDDIGAALLSGGGDVFHRMRGVGVVVVDHLDLFGTDTLGDDGTFAFLEGGLEDKVFIRSDRALNHVLTEPPGAGDKDRVLEARLGINGEQNARAGGIGANHLLDNNGEIDIKLAEVLVVAVRNGAVGEQAGKTLTAIIEDGVIAPDIEIGLLLAGKGGVGKVFGGGGGANGDINILAVLSFHLFVGIDDRIFQILREFSASNNGAHLLAAFLEISKIMGVKPIKGLTDGIFNAC